jgi:large subunit ribosomal protein L10
MDRNQKTQSVTELNGLFTESSAVIVAHYSGLSVSQMNDLRTKMRDAGASFKVAKNRLAKLALEGTPIAEISDLFSGPTGIGYSEDPVAAPKVLVNFAKDNENLVILGGAAIGSILDLQGVKALAALPSLDELRGKIVSLIQAPATKIAGVLQAPAGQMARVLSAYANKAA